MQTPMFTKNNQAAAASAASVSTPTMSASSSSATVSTHQGNNITKGTPFGRTMRQSFTIKLGTQVMGNTSSTNLWKTLENMYEAHSNSKMNTVRTSIQTTRKGSSLMDEYLK
ncbi:hypothetical protein Ddye_031135 [Dipteronia dyeriana]|uniref:Uncharacterized protein n=1 Tax=Dipteronia dyeriana TaxID=168575 RepID=A0AAD9THQ6_9ROSI|nr:hypothetical protein Ddye_031131 [Dipteronia dyeriana]KAK2636343.1 hypothetical protein Ddye_031135 [Dipteronia dyeriana]